MIRTLTYRAETIISDVYEQREEKEHIKTALGRCGYPDWAFHKASQRKSDTETETPTENRGQSGQKPARVNLPYVCGISERIKKVLQEHKISASLKPTNQLRSMLVNVKDKTPRDKRSHLVYGFQCPDKDCDHTYVGETQQALKKRMSQHRRPSPDDQPDSAIYTHLSTSGHSFSDKDVIILDTEERWHARGVKEAIWDRVENPTLNKVGGLRFKLSHTWNRALRDIPSRLNQHPQQLSHTSRSNTTTQDLQ